MMWHDGSTWWWMGLSMLLFWGLVVWSILALAEYLRRPARGKNRNDRPEDILAERFAGGEMSVEDYKRRLEILRSFGARETEEREAPQSAGTAPR